MEIHEQMNAMEVRLAMKEHGWSSNDDLSSTGWEKFGYSIWFERWDWHGVKIGRVCIHDHINDLSKINETVYRLAQKVLQAWNDFQDSVPHQMANGSLKADPIQTPYYLKGKEKETGLDKESRKQLLNELSENKQY